MQKININDLKDGMKFTEPVHIDENNILVPKGVGIKQKDIERLKKWGIKFVVTEGNLLTAGEDETLNNDIFGYNLKPFIRKFEECLNTFGTELNNFVTQNKIDRSKIESIINILIEIIDKYKDEIINHIFSSSHGYNYMFSHSLNVTVFSLLCGMALKFSPHRLRQLGIGALLHDVGMLIVPDAIVNKKTKLTEDEFKQIQAHTVHGYQKLKKLDIFSNEVTTVALQHHEQYDGNGYPRKLKGDDIHLYSRIVSVADSYDAQVSDRVYRKDKKTGYMAVKDVLAESQNKFDPKILRAFLASISIYPPGSLVQLNNNAIGSVTAINNKAPLRPKVRIWIDEFGDNLKEEEIVDLTENKNLFIVKVLNKEEFDKERQFQTK